MIKVIKASAGSGKTYQLTYEYIKMLLGVKRKGRYELAPKQDKERHRHILAVTFTNKATAEMKERIIKELKILSGRYEETKSDYLADLCKDFGNVSEQEVRDAAYDAMVEILFDYTNFNVSTIDAFFQMILRTFAKELKMSYNYDVEIDDDYAIKVGVNDLFMSLAHSMSATEEGKKRARRVKSWIREFVHNEVQNGGKWNVFDLKDDKKDKTKPFKRGSSFSFKNFFDCLKKEDTRQYLDDIVTYIDAEYEDDICIAKFKGKLYEKMNSLKKQICKAREKVITIGENAGFKGDLIPKSGGLAWLYQLVPNGEECLPTQADINKMISNNLEKGNFYKKPTKKMPAVWDEFIESAILVELKTIHKCYVTYHIYKNVHRNIYMLGLLGEVKRYMELYRKENDMILLGDTNEMLRRIINKEETPFVYERVGIWLSHFLIDEFQDTSRAQWENMKPLLFNSCAEGSDNLIIGDEKQCIYRFRNADSSLLRNDVGRHFTVNQNDGSKSCNWRSMPNVVEFNNEFFKTLSKDLGLAEEYQNVEQALPSKKDYDNPGYVEVNVIDVPQKEKNTNAVAEGAESKEAMPNNANYASDEKFNEIVLSRLPDLIKELNSRGYKFKDIAILVYSNSTGTDVVNHLLKYNSSVENVADEIPVVANDSLWLKNCASVRLIISHLRYLNSKLLVSADDKSDMAESIRKRMDNEGYLHRILRNYERLKYEKENVTPGDALRESIKIESKKREAKNNNNDSLQVSEDYMSIKSLLPDNTESFNIVSITEHIIAQNIHGEKLKVDNPFIQAFQDCVVDFSNRPNPSISEFLKWWDNGGCYTSIISPEGQDAVNVITIHKSKGLEYKCVILPFCNWDLGGKEEVLWIPKDEANGLFGDIDDKLIPPIFPLMPKKDMDITNSAISAYYDKKIKERVFDELNKTYVGFTRAVDEMYIFTPRENTKKSVVNPLNSYLCALVEDGNNQYTQGEKGHYVPKKKEKTKATNADNTKKDKSNALSNKMPDYKVDNIKLKYKVSNLYGNEAQERGVRLHNIMKRIRTKDDVDTALLYFKARGVLNSKNYEEDSKTVREILEHKRVQWWFDPQNRIYNERSMVNSEGEVIRSDRFFITPDGRTVVIDYKFAKKTPKKVKDDKKQVSEYIDVLESVGFKNVEGYIWYPLLGDNENAIEKVK